VYTRLYKGRVRCFSIISANLVSIFFTNNCITVGRGTPVRELPKCRRRMLRVLVEYMQARYLAFANQHTRYHDRHVAFYVLFGSSCRESRGQLFCNSYCNIQPMPYTVNQFAFFRACCSSCRVSPRGGGLARTTERRGEGSFSPMGPSIECLALCDCTKENPEKDYGRGDRVKSKRNLRRRLRLPGTTDAYLWLHPLKSILFEAGRRTVRERRGVLRLSLSFQSVHAYALSSSARLHCLYGTNKKKGVELINPPGPSHLVQLANEGSELPVSTRLCFEL
jgi:hypothetical protein